MSLTIQGWVIGVIVAVFAWADVPVASDNVEGFVVVIGGLFSIVSVYLGRLRLGDIYWWGGRRPGSTK